MTSDEINKQNTLLRSVYELLLRDSHCRYRGQGRLKTSYGALYHRNREQNEVIYGDLASGALCDHPEDCRTAERFRDLLATTPLGKSVRSRPSALA